MRMRGISKFGLFGCSSAAVMAALLAATPVAAQEQARAFNIPAGDLGPALNAFARQSDREILFTSEIVAGKRSAGLHGQYEPRAALDRLLAGSGLQARTTSGGQLVVEAAGPQSQGVQEGPNRMTGVEEVVVTGTRIKGVAPSSPVITLTQQSIQDAGMSTVADAIRAIPQNFSGGQNPGVAVGSGGINNQNLTGSSAINLRGLGPDATLTLLNGRRLSYDAFTQAVDVSIIPLAAINQIQVVTDGASAIYGSDAVAGVANIILKRDFEGLTATARYGGATDGGDVQSQYNLVGGRTWDTGGFIATYNYEHDTSIYSDQRSYTQYMPGPSSLLPASNEQSVLFSGHQDLTPRVHFSIDGLYSDRKVSQVLTEPPSRIFYVTHTKEYLASPTISFDLPHAWSLSVNGLVGKEASDYSQPFYDLGGNLLSPAKGCYCNGVKQVEADAEGPVARLPGGDARLAVGAGYRINTFDNPSFTSGSDISGDRKSYYLFGELNLPLVSPEQGIPGLRSLTVNGAARYESYNDIGDVATPKIGVTWSPVADLELRASWGKSFKAPTLLQQYENGYAELIPAAEFGATGSPANATALLLGGGNRNLKPEKATTFTTGFTYRPHYVEGLKLEASYFHINYRDRVVEPISNLAQSLLDPAYAQFVTYDPTAAQQQAALAKTTAFYNFAGPPYDPSLVAAMIDNTFTNVARQTIDGVDLSADYTRPFAGGSLTATGTASWLNATEVISPGQPEVPISGVIYNPPHFRARAGLIWSHDDLTVAGYVNHQSGLTDNLTLPFSHIDSLTTVDLAGTYRIATGPHLLRDVTISLAVQNLFDKAPPYVQPAVNYLVDYDSTNASPIGRFISLTVSKHW